MSFLHKVCSHCGNKPKFCYCPEPNFVDADKAPPKVEKEKPADANADGGKTGDADLLINC